MRAFLAWVHTRLSRFPATLAATVAASLLFTPPAAVGDCPDLFPKITCFERIDPTTIAIFFGVDNFLNQSITPSVNFFDPPDFVPPTSFDPGFTPRVFRITVDINNFSQVAWILGCRTLVVDTLSLPDTLLCASPVPGPPGPTGPAGPSGPPGPSGPSPLAGCQTVTTASSTRTATAACPTGRQVLTGGGRCDKQPHGGHGELQASNPAPDLSAWLAECKEGHATAYGVCCPTP